MEIQHFSHMHPLILSEDGEEFWCHGCWSSNSGPAYSCRKCKFFLHKSCAELPRELRHPLHTTHHPLTLLANRPFLASHCTCIACKQYRKGFIYHCSICNFNLDIVCASNSPLTIQHHQHPLTPMKPASFVCDACGSKHKEDISYFCNSCYFWLHRDCALLAVILKKTHHHHPLSLIYSIPLEYSKFRTYCDICSLEMKTYHWLYWCSGCKYFAHLNCAMMQTEHVRDDTAEILADDVVSPHMPVPDESLLVTHIFEQISPKKDRKESDDVELKHFSHDHPLTFSDVTISNKTCSEYKYTLSEGVKNYRVCEACLKPISGSSYNCVDCNFFLHECCAMLPTRIKHPSHQCDSEQVLTLFAESPNHFGIFCCGACRKRCNGFCYHCLSCDFSLDVVCGSLGRTIKHEAHVHHLVLTMEKSKHGCKACDQDFIGYAYGCSTCKFYLHIECALLPSKATHKYDKQHPLSLTFSPAELKSDEYYCDDCEEEINQKTWFYHCADCDSSAHAKCICKFDPYSNIKFGSTYELKVHPHPLTLVRKTRDKLPCGCCGYIFTGLALQCSQCSLNLHIYCAL